MKKIALLFIVFGIFQYINAVNFKVASYNVYNLFDLNNDGTEYDDFLPNTKFWHKKSYKNKLAYTAKVINDANASIISLQEIENENTLKELLKFLPQYKYYKFIKNPKAAIGTAILSKYRILSNKIIKTKSTNQYARNILRSTIQIQDSAIIIYSSHWPSKKAPESFRIYYANAIKKDIKTLENDDDYIILGDLNSNYNEFQTFKYEKKINNTFGITGINQILNTTQNGNFVDKNTIKLYDENSHYNLWLDLNEKDRFSFFYKGMENTPDNILISKSLLDSKNISYVENTFNVFKPEYLYKNKKIKVWNKYSSKGYSDHLLVHATFTNEIKDKKVLAKEKSILYKANIAFLYEIQTLQKSIVLNDVYVIYKNKKMAIIKQENNRAIMVYNPPKNLKLGFNYNLKVHEIDRFKGIKEIKKLSIIKENFYDNSYGRLFVNASSIELTDLKNQNEIINNISGTYKKNFFYYNVKDKERKINIYFKKGVSKPKNNEQISLKTVHLSKYKSLIQLVIHKNNDFF